MSFEMTSPSTPRAMLCHAWGEPASLELGTIKLPLPGPDEVVIDVAAAGVNFADVLMVAGKYQEKPPFPFSPGLEVAGTVRICGSEVTQFAPGQRVMALLDRGGYSEAAVAKASDVFALPDAIDFTAAAGLPITYGTAHGALVWRAGLQPSETLVVHGAAGGVGLATVEVGKALGATVIATAGGAEKLAVAKAAGADHLIDYKEEDLRLRIKELTDGRGADVFFDPVGGKVFEASMRSAAWGARLLVIGFAGGDVPQIPANILLVKNLSAIGLYWGSYRRKAPDMVRAQFEQIFDWVVAGKLKPHVSHALDLAQAAEAMTLLKERRSTGKVVLTMNAS